MLEMSPLLDGLGTAIYAAQAYTAIHGLFLVVLAIRRVAQKRFSSNAAANGFLAEVGEPLQAGRLEEAAEICDTPAYWAKATPQLLLVAIQNRTLPGAKLRELVAERFDREVLADLDYHMAWINTLVKTAPMLGLLGTVVGMIAAFGKIAGSSRTGVDPTMLANDISFALLTTAIGLTIAIPLVIAGAAIQVRIGRLQDSVQDQLAWLLPRVELAARAGGRPAATSDR